MEQMKKINFLLLTSVILFGVVFGFSAKAKANDPGEPSILSVIASGGTVEPGYVNNTNSGYSIRVDLTDLVFFEARVLVNNQLLQKAYEPGIFEYSLGEIGVEPLHKIFPEGKNEIELELCDKDNSCTKVNYQALSADYTSPEVGLMIETTNDEKILGIGDIVYFNLESNEKIKSSGVEYNGHKLELADLGGGEYRFEYGVEKGDLSSDVPLQFNDWEMSDLSGNTIYLDSQNMVDFTIDAALPKIQLESPKDHSVYKTKNIDFKYSSDEKVIVRGIKLDAIEVSAESLHFDNLTDGIHDVEITFVDMAGNISVIKSSFTIDSTAPFLAFSLIDGERVELGRETNVSGTTEPGLRIELDIGERSYSAISDSGGEWSFAIDSNCLGEGLHSLTVSVIDAAGNITIRAIGTIEVYVPAVQTETVVLAAITQEPTKSDVKPTIVSRQAETSNSQATNNLSPAQEDNGVAATGGVMTSDQSERVTTLNWSLLLVILAMLVLISAVAAAGYYGYEWILAANVHSEAVLKKKKAEKIENESNQNAKNTQLPKSKKDEPPRMRW